MRTEKELTLPPSPNNSLAKTTPAKRIKIFEAITFYGLSAVIFFAAIPYGTVEPWFKLLFVSLVCIFAVFRVLDSIINNTSVFSNKLFFAPLGGILVLAILQIIPFADFIGTFDLKYFPVSLNIYATKNFILIFTGLLITAEALVQYTNSEQRMRYLIYLIFVISMGSTFFGFARILFLDESGFLSSYLSKRIHFAQFVNHNHFAYLMEMNLGLLIGLQLKGKLPQWQKPFYWLMTAISCFSIIWVSSRGGILAMVGLSIFAVFLYFFAPQKDYFELQSKSPQKRKYLQPILIAILFSTLLFGFAAFAVSFVGGDPVVNRIESIQEEIAENDTGKISRREIWLSTIALIKAYPIFGAGFGAYSTAITAYDKSSGESALQQAHNDYLEILANGGIIAFVLMLIFIFLLIKRIGEQLKSGSNFRRATCFGATLGIFGIMLHSIVEFGLHIIINALVLIILIVLATAKTNSRNRKETDV